MKIYLLILMVVLQMATYGQTLTKKSFVNYEEVINELQSTDNIGGLGNKYNYVFLLLLDSTNIQLIEKTGHPNVSEFRDYASGLPLPEQTVGFVTDKHSITEIFLDETELKRILDCTHILNSPDLPLSKFGYPIYIKGNEAVFEIFGPTWSDTYSARLENGIFQISWLGGKIE